MADEFCFSLLNTSTIQLLQAVGFESSQTNATHVLTDIFEHYIQLLASSVSAYSRLSGRTYGNIGDVINAFNELSVNTAQLKEWISDETRFLSPCWTEQGDPSRILEGIIKNGLNNHNDSITYEYGHPLSLEAPPGEEIEEETNEPHNHLPAYIPSYLPEFPTIITNEDDIESNVTKPKLPSLPLTSASVLPLPNIVKQKKKPIDNPFTHLKPFEDSLLAITDSDHPESLSLSLNTADSPKESADTPKLGMKRRRSEALIQIMNEIQSPKQLPNISSHILEKSAIDEAAPGNTMFTEEKGLLDRLVIDSAPTYAIPKLMTPNLLMDIIVPVSTVSQPTTNSLRLNLSGFNTRKPSINTTIDEAPSQSNPISLKTMVSTTNNTTDNLNTSHSPSNGKLSGINQTIPHGNSNYSNNNKNTPISLSSASLNQKDQTATDPRESDKNKLKPKKKLTINLPVSRLESNAKKESSIITPPLSTPKIRFKIKIPEREEIKPKVTTDVINCICDNPTVDYGTFMIACDSCGVWYHGLCVNIAENDPIEEWHCRRCS
ncbi:hypothetical protein BDB01DRAFT_901700 [Pilobolus umbonatus]|nr:hypothetical protein BDB01DRAFT_901700 [Pilobolus umbonatus]